MHTDKETLTAADCRLTTGLTKMCEIKELVTGKDRNKSTKEKNV
jgi:hypothetical protein